MKDLSNKKEYYFKYIKKLLLLYLFWSLIYLYWNFDFNSFGMGITAIIKEILWYIWMSVMIGSHFHLWFIPALIFSISVLYLAQTKGISKQLIVFFMIVYTIGLLGDSYYGLISNSPLDKYFKLYFRYLGSTYNGFFFGTIYVLVGANIKSVSYKRNIYLLFSLISFFFLTLESILLNLYNIPKDYNLYITLLPFTYFFMKYLISFESPSSELSKKLRHISMDLYFSHGLFLIIIPLIYYKYGFHFNNFILFINVTLFSLLLCLSINRIKGRKKKVFSF
jgi:serine/alanine racemase